MADNMGYVFKPMPKKGSAFGITLKGWAAVLLTAALGAGLAFALGSWKHVETVDLNFAERSVYVDELTDERDALAAVDKATGRLADETYALAEAGEADGLSASTTDEEIDAMAPSTKEAWVPVIPDVPRWMAFFFAPTLVVAAGCMQFVHNSCFFAEAARWARNARVQREFRSRPYEYMDGFIR